MSLRQLRKWLTGYLFAMPVILGLLFFTFYPMGMSLYYSFTKYDILSEPRWIGLQNYQDLLSNENFMISLGVTLRYALVSVPLNLILSGLIALLLNRQVRGISIYRVILYIPVIVPAIAAAYIFRDIFNVDYGIANWVLRSIGLPENTWISRPETALNSLIVMNIWGVGGGIIIWLAGLRSIPQHLYDAAKVDGAGPLHRLWNVTVPMLSPVIFFNLVLGIIGGLQTFTQVYVITNGSGGPDGSTLFMVMNIFSEAFVRFRMGFASAIAWVLFLIIAALTALIFRTSFWVYYEGGDKR